MHNSGSVHCSRDPQTSLFSNFFIKNGFHDIIHTFKNYFVTVFLVFSKIICIQTDPLSLYFPPSSCFLFLLLFFFFFFFSFSFLHLHLLLLILIHLIFLFLFEFDYGQWFWVCNFGSDFWQIFPLHGWWFWGFPLTVVAATSSSSIPCSFRRSTRRSKHQSTLSVFVGVSMCGCVWFCGVCCWFLILCLWECVYQRKIKMMRAREKKMSKIRNY